ncbi:MAG: S9 family peptidase, partial [Candidatus Electrothrix sp. ATG1]|nr:S9 family peptidase [Candidatus Electrothrix sp. ATG1]
MHFKKNDLFSRKPAIFATLLATALFLFPFPVSAQSNSKRSEQAGFAEEGEGSLSVNVGGKQIDDPYLWLEEVSSEKALAWARERNRESLGELGRSDRFQGLQQRFLEILDSEDKIPYLWKIADHYYNFWRDAQHPCGFWRRTSLAEYRKDQPAWETVLDLDALARSEKENWVWHGATVLQPEGRRCIIALSRGGADAAVQREFDLVAKQFVRDGFSLA